MQKQMIVKVPEYLFEQGGVEQAALNSIFSACSDFLKGDVNLIAFPDTFSYEIKEVDTEISEVVLTIDKGEVK